MVIFLATLTTLFVSLLHFFVCWAASKSQKLGTAAWPVVLYHNIKSSCQSWQTTVHSKVQSRQGVDEKSGKCISVANGSFSANALRSCNLSPHSMLPRSSSFAVILFSIYWKYWTFWYICICPDIYSYKFGNISVTHFTSKLGKARVYQYLYSFQQKNIFISVSLPIFVNFGVRVVRVASICFCCQFPTCLVWQWY